MSRAYVTTPIYYVNDLPHIGHIYTTVVCDAIARFWRLSGRQVYFLTGTDEHGQKIERAAQARGITPLALADEVVARYHQLWQQLGISHDDFIRTTEGRHRLGVEAIVRRMAAAGDFYISRHEGWYCTGCETFYTEKELLPGNLCPIHRTVVEAQAEENVFFRLSKYQDALLKWYDENPGCVCPPSRANEVRTFVASGLRDLSVSRTQFDWGVPFPDHEGHTVYVWLDALTNYISALGFGRGEDEAALYRNHWEEGAERVHLVGKDILRFHAVYWPAFLMSAGLPMPTTVWAHGWWLRDEQKMSKSVGNIVRPDYLVERFGVDALRYFLLREMAFGQDASFSDEAFIDRYNSDLANDLGNTVSRLVTLSRRAFDGAAPPRPAADGALQTAAEESVAAYRDAMERFAFHRALEALWRLLAEANQYLVKREPWKKLRDPAARDEVAATLWNAFEAVRIVAVGLAPVMPERSTAVLTALGATPATSLEAMTWGSGTSSDDTLPDTGAIFPRIDKKAYIKALEDEMETAEEKAPPATQEASDDGRIGIDQFAAVTLRVATVLAAEAVPKSKKLLKLTVDVGEESTRTVVAGIAAQYEPADLVDTQVVVVANLKPAKLMGTESNGMVLAASEDGKPILLRPERTVPNGTRVR